MLELAWGGAARSKSGRWLSSTPNKSLNFTAVVEHWVSSSLAAPTDLSKVYKGLKGDLRVLRRPEASTGKGSPVPGVRV
jgi:hypothetical protein